MNLATVAMTARFLAKASSVPPNAAGRLLRRAIGPGGGDGAILARLRAALRHTRSRNRKPAPNASARAKSRVEPVRKLLAAAGGEAPKVARYLDVGCSEGGLTEAFGAMFGLPPSRTHGCDVRADAASASAAFVFAQAQAEELPYEDGSMGAVSFAMALHHVENVGAALDEARRVLAPGGLLIIREHDCPDYQFALYLDAVHFLYAAVLGDEIELPPGRASEAFEGHRAERLTAWYDTQKGWAKKIAGAGFVSGGVNLYTPWGKPDRFRGYFEVFVKTPK